MPSRIGDALRWYATYTPTKTAIISAQGEQSYAQLWARVRRLANSLTKLGIDPGDRKGQTQAPPRARQELGSDRDRGKGLHGRPDRPC